MSFCLKHQQISVNGVRKITLKTGISFWLHWPTFVLYFDAFFRKWALISSVNLGLRSFRCLCWKTRQTLSENMMFCRVTWQLKSRLTLQLLHTRDDVTSMIKTHGSCDAHGVFPQDSRCKPQTLQTASHDLTARDQLWFNCVTLHCIVGYIVCTAKKTRIRLKHRIGSFSKSSNPDEISMRSTTTARHDDARCFCWVTYRTADASLWQPDRPLKRRLWSGRQNTGRDGETGQRETDGAPETRGYI